VGVEGEIMHCPKTFINKGKVFQKPAKENKDFS
jgi:hypothetical protein